MKNLIKKNSEVCGKWHTLDLYRDGHNNLFSQTWVCPQGKAATGENAKGGSPGSGGGGLGKPTYSTLMVNS